jgi:23S rRNA (cytidine1920-2'-O)/16S rRNA (cytidine1409-2'-O)-methyltransferase
MRADKFLVENNYFESRAKAREAIEAGLVFANAAKVAKPSQILSCDMAIEAQAAYPWVSRAGLKLEHALKVFDVDPARRTCLDVGASTGGFTQVLRENGAHRVYAVDVGRDQLHSSLRNDPIIVSMEQTDARDLSPNDFETAPDLIVCDVSFISCMKALKAPLSLAANKADLVTLVKPQFEVGKGGIGKGGIVRDQKLARKSVDQVKIWLNAEGWLVKSEDVSPIKGGAGNTEYLLHAACG